jgi:hypothetical protein
MLSLCSNPAGSTVYLRFMTTAGHQVSDGSALKSLGVWRVFATLRRLRVRTRSFTEGAVEARSG